MYPLLFHVQDLMEVNFVQFRVAHQVLRGQDEDVVLGSRRAEELVADEADPQAAEVGSSVAAAVAVEAVLWELDPMDCKWE